MKSKKDKISEEEKILREFLLDESDSLTLEEAREELEKEKGF
ncbi:MAG: hypothetical protein ACQESE_03990 [Nanobdellota archaeon]